MNDMQQQLEEATQEELRLCIELLVLFIAQHRTKFGAVTFRKSMELLRARAEGAEQSKFFLQGNEMVEAALEMVRLLTSVQETPADSGDSDAARTENRKQFRITVNSPIKVLWPDASLPVAATLENISWGGAVIHVAQSKAEPGDTLRILIPGARGGSISIEASILRTWLLPEGNGQGMATRFSSLRSRDEAEFEMVLERLAQSADHQGQRNTARLTQRLDIEYNDIEELEATLDDISAGGLGITVPEPLQIGQSLQAVISTLDGSCSLKLRARVVRQDAIKIRNIQFFRAGLKFEHPSEELHENVSELIRKIAGARNRKLE